MSTDLRLESLPLLVVSEIDRPLDFVCVGLSVWCPSVVLFHKTRLLRTINPPQLRSSVSFSIDYKKGAVHVCRSSPNHTLQMRAPPTLSTPQHSWAHVKPPNVPHLSPLPSTVSVVPAFILPPRWSDAEHVLPRNFNTVMRHNSSTSPLTTSSHSAMFDRSTLVSTLPSPRPSITEISCSTPTVYHDNNGTLMCHSDQKIKCARKGSASANSPRPIHQIFPLCSQVENIPILQLAPSVSDLYRSPCNNNKSKTRHSALSSPTKSTHINDVPLLILPSSLPSIGDDISALCLSSAVCRKWKRRVQDNHAQI